MGRCGADMFDTIYVDYATSDGTASGGGDYVHTEGTLTFKPGETSKSIVVPVIDDDIFELDEYFFCKLTSVRAEPKAQAKHVLGTPDTATITILDDDYPGVFTLEHERYEVMETVGFMTLRIVRLMGARGIIRLPYYTAEGTAKGGGEDFEDCVGEIEFKDEETVKTIDIRITDGEEYEKCKKFSVFLGEPRIVQMEKATIGLMMWRRNNPNIGAELGGPPGWRKITSIVLAGFWLTYVALSAMEAYCFIDPGF